MNKEQKRYQVSFLGKSYSIVSDESEQHIRQVEKKVNDVLDSIAVYVQLSDEKSAAVLTALQIASDFIKKELVESGSDILIQELTSLIDSEICTK